MPAPLTRIAVTVALLGAATAHARDTATPEAQRALLASLSVASPYRMPASARAGEIRYRITLPADVAWTWPQTGEQQVELLPDGVRLRVCDDCGTEPAPDAATLDHLRAANAWVQSDDPRLRSYARRSSRSGSVDTVMTSLVAAVQARMTGPIVYDGYQDARTAFDSRSGDCTEAALLLAAFGRARGIPVRVVYGVAYASRFAGQRQAFGPHMWVQAWDGTRWRSYDAGLGRFDSGHVALATGDGTPSGADGLPALVAAMRITEAAGVRR